MAQLIVRNLEESVKARLHHRAQRNGRSMEAEVRDILRNAVKEVNATEQGLGTAIATLVKGTGFKFEAPELRGVVLQPPRFDVEK